MDQTSVNPESPSKDKEPSTPKPKTLSEAVKPPQDVEQSVEMIDTTVKKQDVSQIKAEMAFSISDSPKASFSANPVKEIHSAKPAVEDPSALNQVRPEMSPGPAQQEPEDAPVDIAPPLQAEERAAPVAEPASVDLVERVNAQVQVDPRDYDLEEPQRQERFLDHFDPISILEPEDQDLQYDHLKRQAQTRYCMLLMIYILVFNLFFLRLITMDSQGQEDLSSTRDEFRHSQKAFLRMMQVYEVLNLGEYWLTLLYLLVSMIFFDKTHNVVGSNKLLRPYLLYSWILNLAIQAYGAYCLWNKDAEPLADSSPLLESHLRLVENMIGIRMACYFILTTAIVVFFCLYGCFVVMTNRLDLGIDSQGGPDQSERKKKEIIAHLTKISKDYSPRGSVPASTHKSPTNRTVPVFPEDPDYPEQCTICFKDFVAPLPGSEENSDNAEERSKEKVVELACSRKHVYHLTCLKEWISYSDICPICKAQIAID